MTTHIKGAELPGAPQDGTTLTDVLAGYAEAGYNGTFTARENAAIECNTCGEISPAAEVSMSSMQRLEGASDPADMMSVAAIACPKCGRTGVIVLGYGPNATPEDADVSKAIRDQRADDAIGGNSAPGEAAGDGHDR